MNTTDFSQNTFEFIQSSMDFNGYAHFDYEAYKKQVAEFLEIKNSSKKAIESRCRVYQMV